MQKMSWHVWRRREDWSLGPRFKKCYFDFQNENFQGQYWTKGKYFLSEIYSYLNFSIKKFSKKQRFHSKKTQISEKKYFSNGVFKQKLSSFHGNWLTIDQTQMHIWIPLQLEGNYLGFKSNPPAILLKKKLCHRYFPENFGEFLKTPFL